MLIPPEGQHVQQVILGRGTGSTSMFCAVGGNHSINRSEQPGTIALIPTLRCMNSRTLIEIEKSESTPYSIQTHAYMEQNVSSSGEKNIMFCQYVFLGTLILGTLISGFIESKNGFPPIPNLAEICTPELSLSHTFLLNAASLCGKV